MSENKQKVQLQPITESDLLFLFKLYASTRQEEMAQTGWDDQQIAHFLEFQFYAQHHHYTTYFPDAQFDKIIVNQREAGRLYVHRREDEILIIDIALLPEFRNQGIGYSIMQDLLEEGRQKNLPVRLHVEKNNPAQRFYDRLGFKQIDDIGVSYLMEWNPSTKKS